MTLQNNLKKKHSNSLKSQLQNISVMEKLEGNSEGEWHCGIIDSFIRSFSKCVLGIYRVPNAGSGSQ